jgi:FkbM family methyltransferase
MSIAYSYATKRAWAQRTLGILNGFFDAKPGGRYLDIGANIGLTTVPIASRGVETLAFEPEPNNYRYLCQNVARNGVQDRVRVMNVALNNRAGVVSFELSPSNHGDNRIRTQDTGPSLLGESQWQVIEVECCRGDDLDLATDRPLAIKVDTQGAEPFVLEGARNTFACADLAILEFSPYWLARMGADPQHIYRWVSELETVSFATGESGVSQEPISGASAAAFLSNYYEENRGRPVGAYLDVVGRRTRSARS